MNRVYFTKVFKGYNPDEVEEFIIKLNNDIQQKQLEFADSTKRLSSEINEQKKRFEEAIIKNEKFIEENRILISEKQQLEEENRILISEKQQLEEENKKLSEMIAKLSSDKAIRNEEPKEIPVAKTQEEEKFDYRQLCEKMGEKFLVADMRAGEIIKEAEAEAGLILAKAKAEAGEEIKRLVAQANKKVEQISRAVEEYEKKQVFIAAGLDQARRHLGDAIGEVEALLTENTRGSN